MPKYDIEGINAEVFPAEVPAIDITRKIQNRYDIEGLNAEVFGGAPPSSTPRARAPVDPDQLSAATEAASYGDAIQAAELARSRKNIRDLLGDKAPPLSEFNLQDAKRKMNAIQMDHVLRDAPVTAKMYTDLVAGGKTPYDMENMATIEKLWGGQTPSRPSFEQNWNTFKKDMSAIADAVQPPSWSPSAGALSLTGLKGKLQTTSPVLEFLVDNPSVAERVIKAMPRDIASGTYSQIAGALATVAPAEILTAKALEPLVGKIDSTVVAEVAQFIQGYAESVANRVPDEAGDIERGLRSGAKSLGMMSLPLGWGAVAQKYAAEKAAGAMAAGTGGLSFMENYDETGDVWRGLVHMISDAGYEYALERVGGTGVLLDKTTWSNGFFKGLLQFGTVELPSEVLTTIGQEFDAWVLQHPDKSFDEFMAGLRSAEVQTIVATAFGMGGQVGIVKGIEKIVEVGRATENTESQGKDLAELFKLAAVSEIRETDPETFAQALGNVTQDAVVGLDRVVLVQAMEQAGVPAEAIPSLAEQAGALGDVDIPVAELVTALAGTEAEAAIIPHIRMEPDAPTLAEQRLDAGRAFELFQEAGKRAMAKHAEQTQFQTALDTVKEEIRADLDARGAYGAQANARFTDLVGHFYATLADRLNVSPLQARDGWVDANGKEHRGYKLRVLGEDTGARARIPATIEDFTPGRVGNILQRDNWAIVTAENPQGKTLTPEENATRQAALKAELDKQGIKYEQIEGKYVEEGQEETAPLEHPFLLTDIDLQRARALGKMFDQGSIISRHGLVYHDGTVQRAKRVTEHKTEPKNYWSRVPSTGALFTADLDFDARVPLDDVLGQSVSIRTKQEGLRKYGLAAGGKYTVREVAAALEARQRAKYGHIDPTDTSPEAAKKIAKWMVEEVLFEMQHPENSGVGWYSHKFQRALDKLANLFPELKTDQSARDTMTLFIAITSDGAKVMSNTALAVDLYSSYRATGKVAFKDRGHNRELKENLAAAQALLDAHGEAGVKAYLLQEATVKDLKAFAAENGLKFSTSYTADTVLPLSAVVLGPKLGAFYSNLMGSHGYLTMDRWWSRTFNRYRGALITAPTAQGLDRFRALLGQPELSDDETIAATVSYRNSYAAKGYKDGSETEKAANTIYKAAFEGLNDRPFRPSDRTFMIAAAKEAQTLLTKKGQEISIADLQAILWYYEKKLYGELGSREPGGISYEEAAATITNAIESGAAERSAAQYVEDNPPSETDQGAVGYAEEGTYAQGAAKGNLRGVVVDGTDLRGDGKEFTSFFTDATHGGRKPDIPPAPLLDLSGMQDFTAEYMKHRGDFDDHIAASIPGFRDVQQVVGAALLDTYAEKGADILDIGASEGALIKTVSALSDGRIRTLGLDPNLAMAEHFAKESVPGAEYSVTAFGSRADEGQLAWTEGDVDINFFAPDKKYDVVHEAMVFQFISNGRNAQVARSKELLKQDGLALFEEKTLVSPTDGQKGVPSSPEFLANEAKKDAYKAKHFSAEAIAKKKADVLERGADVVAQEEAEQEKAATGMNDLMATRAELEAVLMKNFKHVVQYWDSGNFQGYAASDSLTTVSKFLDNLQSTNTEFSNVRTPRFLQQGSAAALTTPPVNEDGTITLYHYSDKGGVAELDPAYFGKGLPGAERKRKEADPDNWVNRTSYGIALGHPGGYAKEAGLGANLYEVRVPAGKMYDFQRDPDGLRPKSVTGWDNPTSVYEKAIRDAGYTGFWTQHPSLGLVGVSFDKQTAAPSSGVFYQGGGFTAWTAGREVVPVDETHNIHFVSGKPVVVGAYHGTTGDFTVFSKERANPESNMGAGFYATNTADDVSTNYAGEGPDLTMRIELLAERIAQDTDRGYDDPQVIKEAKAALAVQHGGMVLPVWVRFDNPFVMGGPTQTELELNIEEDEDGDITESGSLLDFMSEFREVASGYRDGDAEPFLTRLLELGYDNGRVTAEELYAALHDAEDVGYYSDDEGRLVSAEILREAIANLGFDGVIDGTVNAKFGTAGARGGAMAGVHSSTTHFIAFEPNQLKSALGNRGTFDPNDPDILHQDQGGQADRLGTFNPKTLDMRLLAEANLSTFLHETGHFFLSVYTDLANQEDAPADIAKDVDVLLKWFGVPDIQTWAGMSLEQQRPHHERFAESFEQYLFTGKAPTAELQSLFRTFAKFLSKVYGTIKDFLRSDRGANAKLNPEIAAVMDRMLATEKQIAQAEEQREYQNIFKTAAEAGMTPDQFAKYQALPAEARAEAEEALRVRSLRDMKWMQNRRNKVIAGLQKTAKEERAALRAEVAAEVAERPVFRAMRFLKKGETTDATTGEDIVVTTGNKLAIPALEEMFPEGAIEGPPDWRGLGYGKYGMLANEGMHPDVAAEIFGFRSGHELVAELIAAPKFNDEVEGITDQRMLEQHSELATPEGLARAADEAIHNDVRAKALATELSFLNKAMGAPTVLLKAAKDYARAMLAEKSVKGIKGWSFSAMEAREGKLALKAMAKGDREAAAEHKRKELLYHVATKEAYLAEQEIKKTVDRLRKIAAYKDDSSSAKSRNLDMVNAVRAILSRYGIGTERKGKTAREYLELVKTNDPEMGAVLQDIVDATTDRAIEWQKMKLSDLRGLSEAIESVWFLAKRSRQIEVDGKAMSREQAQQELVARMQEIGMPDRVPGEGMAVTQTEAAKMTFGTFRAALRRMSHWVDAKDGADMGPFRRYLWSQIKDAADLYRIEKGEYLRKYRGLLDTVAPTLKTGMIDATEIDYVFGGGKGGIGMSELLHAILHTGNASNKRKLLLGRGWATENADGTLDTTRWDAFTSRMVAEGKLTKAHYEFAQGVWDLMDSMKPAAQKAHRSTFGRYFAEVTADAFSTPFGDYRGGYVPAVADAEIVQDAQLRELSNQENENMRYAYPMPTRGFTYSRVEYNRPLKLDLRALAQHIDKVLLFSHLSVPVSDVRRLVMSKPVSQALGRLDPAAIPSLITPWLNRTAKQIVETKDPSFGRLGRFWSASRSRAGMLAMFANVANSAQQITGVSLAAVKVKPRYLLQAAAHMFTSPQETAAFVTELSPYMLHRMHNDVIVEGEHINAILLDPSVYESTKAWTQKHAYFMQQAVDNYFGPVVWVGAYNQAQEKGLSDTDARRVADTAVQETMGSQLPEDLATFEVGSPFYRMFVQFAGYFNMNANLLGTEFVKVTRDMGLREGAGRGLYVMLLGFYVPAVLGELIIQAFRGGPDDEDKDGEYLDDWLAAIFGYGPARYLMAMVPVVGQLANTAMNAFNNKPYDDRISTAPAISMVESAVKAPQSLYKAIVEEGKPSRAVMDTATLVGMVLGVPARTVAKPISYWADVEADRVEPEGLYDAVRGTISGTATPASKE